MFNLFKKKPKEILVLSKNSFTQADAERIELRTGKVVILADDVNDVKTTTGKVEGDGKAVFFGTGTAEEYQEDQRDQKGLKGIYQRLKDL